MLTDKEFEAINQLHAIAMEHGDPTDPLSAELCNHIQQAQRILMIRAGGRSWKIINDEKQSTKQHSPDA
jgi:hypothetical protein